MLVSISTANSAFQHNYKCIADCTETLGLSYVYVRQSTIDVLFCVRCFFFYSSFICFSRNYYLIQIAVCDDVWLLNCNETKPNRINCFLFFSFEHTTHFTPNTFYFIFFSVKYYALETTLVHQFCIYSNNNNKKKKLGHRELVERSIS